MLTPCPHLPTASRATFSLALFGTSADPPTIGHQAILRWLADQFDRVAVWASDNPLKGPQTPLHHRQQMLRLVVEDLNCPNVNLIPDLSHPRTIHTVATAQQFWPEARITVVIGSDLLPQLNAWYQIDQLLRTVQLLVIPRPGALRVEPALAELRQRGATVAIADTMGPDISSTTYREHRCSQGIISTGIIPTVQAYIHHEHLYPCPDAPLTK